MEGAHGFVREDVVKAADGWFLNMTGVVQRLQCFEPQQGHVCLETYVLLCIDYSLSCKRPKDFLRVVGVLNSRLTCGPKRLLRGVWFGNVCAYLALGRA